MSIRWDSLLVRHLVQELDTRLESARLRAVRLDGRARDLVLLFRERSLVWRLHPERSTLLVRPAVSPAAGDHRLKARLRRVDSPPDERIVRFELVGERAGAGGFEIIVELIGNRLNAVVTEGTERTMRHVLVRREGDRRVVVGERWVAPEPTGRAGIDGDLDLPEWKALLEQVPPPDRPRALVRSIAWTSPLNAATLLEPTLEKGWSTWKRLVDDDAGAVPVILETDRGPQPYPFPLSGHDHRPADGLLEAIEAATTHELDEETAGEPLLTLPPELVERLEETIGHLERRLNGLRAELETREDPEELRAVGDLILARFSDIPAGAERTTLPGFDGEPVGVELDPELSPDENAADYYDRAGRSERAAERIPRLMTDVEGKLERFRDLRDEVAAGSVDADDLKAALPAEARTRRSDDSGPNLPYRTFRSSGGLEIRVGRGAKHNDDLTFHHSAPDDIWLHARHTAGAHVILRWPKDGNPPARDLAQAGVLAALHSKARTSKSVPVDWTRRKYVRKPRGSAPGAVVPDRVKTIFVRPDEEMLEALAD